MRKIHSDYIYILIAGLLGMLSTTYEIHSAESEFEEDGVAEWHIVARHEGQDTSFYQKQEVLKYIPFFKAMMRSGMKEVVDKKVVLDVSPEALDGFFLLWQLMCNYEHKRDICVRAEYVQNNLADVVELAGFFGLSSRKRISFLAGCLGCYSSWKYLFKDPTALNMLFEHLSEYTQREQTAVLSALGKKCSCRDSIMEKALGRPFVVQNQTPIFLPTASNAQCRIYDMALSKDRRSIGIMAGVQNEWGESRKYLVSLDTSTGEQHMLGVFATDSHTIFPGLNKGWHSLCYSKNASRMCVLNTRGPVFWKDYFLPGDERCRYAVLAACNWRSVMIPSLHLGYALVGKQGFYVSAPLDFDAEYVQTSFCASSLTLKQLILKPGEEMTVVRGAAPLAGDRQEIVEGWSTVSSKQCFSIPLLEARGHQVTCMDLCNKKDALVLGLKQAGIIWHDLRMHKHAQCFTSDCIGESPIQIVVPDDCSTIISLDGSQGSLAFVDRRMVDDTGKGIAWSHQEPVPIDRFCLDESRSRLITAHAADPEVLFNMHPVVTTQKMLSLPCSLQLLRFLIGKSGKYGTVLKQSEGLKASIMPLIDRDRRTLLVDYFLSGQDRDKKEKLKNIMLSARNKVVTDALKVELKGMPGYRHCWSDTLEG